MKGVVYKSTGSWYEVKGEDGAFYNCRLRGKFKNVNLKLTNPIAVGDHVDFEVEENQETALIFDIIQRKNYIIRKSSRKRHYSHIIASNIDQALLVVTLKQPRTSVGFIDRFLVSAESFRIPTVIVFNKSDLLNEKDKIRVDELIKRYSGIGYKCLQTSVEESVGIEEFTILMKNKVTLISGHSGVGKSSLLNLINPDLKLATKGLTKFTSKGSHTTTFAQMYELNDNSNVIDTPGIKEFGLENMEKSELTHYFPEMRKYLGQCKFHNCLHQNEPNCAIEDAFNKNEITEDRYNTYLTLLEEVEEVEKR